MKTLGEERQKVSEIRKTASQKFISGSERGEERKPVFGARDTQINGGNRAGYPF